MSFGVSLFRQFLAVGVVSRLQTDEVLDSAAPSSSGGGTPLAGLSAGRVSISTPMT